MCRRWIISILALVIVAGCGGDDNDAMTGNGAGGSSSMASGGASSGGEGGMGGAGGSANSGIYAPTWMTSFVLDYGRFNVVAADAQQNVYLAGEMRGDVDFGNGPQDVADTMGFISSYAPDGSLRFVELFDARDWPPTSRNVDVDDEGNSFLVVPFSSSITIAGQTITGPADAYTWALVSLDPQGGHRWNLVASSTDFLELHAHAGEDDHVHIAATIRPDRPLTIGDTTLSSAGNARDIAWVSIDASGNLTGARSYGGPNTEGANGIVVDETGNAYIAGGFVETAQLGGELLTEADGNGTRFVVSYDASGNHRWSRAVRANTTQVHRSQGGDLLLAGKRTAPTDLGLGPLEGEGAGYVGRVDGDGNALWIFDTPNAPTSVAQGPDGGVFVGSTIPMSSPNYDELYVHLLNGDGQVLQTIRGQSAGPASITDIVVTDDYMYLVGSSDGVEGGPTQLFDFGGFIGEDFDQSGFVAQYERVAR